MGSRKKVILASLVSLMMIFAFAVGLAPSQGRDSILDAKAASGVSAVAVSVDNATPVGESYAIPVGGEQSFSALGLEGGVATQLLTTGGVMWSLGSDGNGVLSSAPGDRVATVTALAPGSADLFVTTADGLLDKVALTFYELKAAKASYPTATSLQIIQPADLSRLYVQTDSVNVPLPVVAVSNSPLDTKPVIFTRSDSSAIGTANAAPFSVTLADIASITTETITAASGSYLSDQPFHATSTFSVTQLDADADGNGLPDAPFTLPNLQPGDLWVASIEVPGGGVRTVLVTSLDTPAIKAVEPLGNAQTTLTYQDPAQQSRVFSVTAPAGLIGANERAVLVLEVADDVETLLGAVEAAKVPSPMRTLAPNGVYGVVSVLVKPSGASAYTAIDSARLALKPLTIEANGVAVNAGDNARFLSYPVQVVNAPSTGAQAQAALGAEWVATSNGTTVGNGVMTAALTSSTMVAPFLTPNNVQATGLSDSSDYSIGGKEVDVFLNNLPGDAVVAVTIDGTTVGTIKAAPGDYLFTVPPAATKLANPASAATYHVRVDITSPSSPEANSFDVLPNAFTYVGPSITAVTPDSGPESGGTPITVTGKGFSASLSAHLDGSVILNTSVVDSTSFTGTTTAHSLGQAGITVVTDKNYEGSMGNAFTYLPSAPQLTSAFPTRVFDDGGYTTRVRGLYFVDPNTEFKVRGQNLVYFTANESQTSIGDVNPGTDVPAANVDFLDDMNLNVLTPVHATGDYKLYAATFIPSNQPKNLNFGPKFGNLFQLSSNVLDFSFASAAESAMTISSIYPPVGPLGGGNSVQINGSGFPAGVALGDIPSGNVLRFGDSAATTFFAQTGVEIQIPVKLFVGPELDGQPATAFANGMTFTINFDPTVLEPILRPNLRPDFIANPDLATWYSESVATAAPAPGQISIVIADVGGNGLAMTTKDDQRVGGTNVQINPFTLFTLRFNVVGGAGASSGLTFTEVRMVNNVTPVPQVLTTSAGQSSFFNVGSGPITPPIPVKVFFGANEATLTGVKAAASQYGSQLTVAAPAGERPGAVDVRVEDTQDPANFAISRANSIYSSANGGYLYTSSFTVNSLSPTKSWLFGGVVAHIVGSGFQYPGAQVYFDGVPAAFAPGFPNGSNDLYVIVPPLEGTTNASPDAITVDVQVTNPWEKNSQDETITLRNAFTYVRWNQKTQSVAGAQGDVFTTSFFFDNMDGLNQAIKLYSDPSAPVATFEVPADILSNAVKTSVPVFGLARASQTPELFGVENIVAGTSLYKAWNFDIHLYSSAYPFEELSIALNTSQSPMWLTFPTTAIDPSLRIDDITIGGTSLFSIESALDYTNFDNPVYTLATTNTGGLKTAYQSNVVWPNYQPRSTTNIENLPADTAVTEVSVRMYSLSAFALRKDAPMPNPNAATALANATGPLAGGTLVSFVGNGLGWPLGVLFGDNPAEMGSLTGRSEYGFTIPAPPGDELGTVDIWIQVLSPSSGGNLSISIPAGSFTYTRQSATLTLNTVGQGSIAVDNPGPYFVGDVVTLTATPASGWQFAGWSGALTGTANPSAVTLTANTVVTATFSATGTGGSGLGLILGLLAALFGLLAGGGDHGGGGPCFIATAAYGTPLADQIDTLRAFRDAFLLDNAAGTALVDAYYSVSPAIADTIAKHAALAVAVRLVLVPVIFMAKLALTLPYVSLALMLLSGVWATFRLRKRGKA